MKKIVLFISIAILPFLGQSQELYKVFLDSYQPIANGNSSSGHHVKFPSGEANIVMGGLNDLDGMGNYFNLYGSKLIIDSLDTQTDGTKKVVLRREDGQDIYGLFPTLNARLVPVHFGSNGDFSEEGTVLK